MSSDFTPSSPQTATTDLPTGHRNTCAWFSGDECDCDFWNPAPVARLTADDIAVARFVASYDRPGECIDDPFGESHTETLEEG